MKKTILFVLGFVVIFTGLYYLNVYFKRGAQVPNDNMATTTGGGVINDLGVGNTGATSAGSYKGQAIDDIGNDPFIAKVPASYVNKYKAELAELKINLMKNLRFYDGWLRVGVLKQFFNDYVGARDAWEYAKVVQKSGPTVAAYNLGGLYGSYLKDYAKAEANYLLAINSDPSLPYLYFALADFYSTFEKKPDLAVAIIEKGLKVIPQDASLKQALAQYQKMVGASSK